VDDIFTLFAKTCNGALVILPEFLSQTRDGFVGDVLEQRHHHGRKGVEEDKLGDADLPIAFDNIPNGAITSS